MGLLMAGYCAWAQEGSSAQPAGQAMAFQGPPASTRKQLPSKSVLPDAPLPQPVTGIDKFQAFVEEASSPLTIGAAGLNALAVREAQEHGAAGMQSSFTSLYEASVVQKESSAFLGKFLYPSLLKQDPRYYPSNSHNFFIRTLYAASRLVITRNDAGKATINTSYLLGVLTSAAVATAYRPYWARTRSEMFADFGSTIGSDAGMNVFREFWPVIRQRLDERKPRFVQKIQKAADHLTEGTASTPPTDVHESK